MATKTEYHIFISHHCKDQEELDKLKDLMKRNGYNIKDSSIDESKQNQAKNKDYIKSILRSRIDWAGAILVLVGSETHTRPWVNWEIEYAAGQNKRIVGVYLWGQSSSRIPAALSGHGHALVRWNTESIVAAIRGEDRWDTGD